VPLQEIYSEAPQPNHGDTINQSIFVYLMTRHHNWHKRNCDLHCRPRMFKG